MGRKLTFKDLQTKKGWPYSRQHTHELVKEGKCPAPEKRPGGGLLNLWDESEWDAYYASWRPTDTAA